MRNRFSCLCSIWPLSCLGSTIASTFISLGSPSLACSRMQRIHSSITSRFDCMSVEIKGNCFHDFAACTRCWRRTACWFRTCCSKSGLASSALLSARLPRRCGCVWLASFVSVFSWLSELCEICKLPNVDHEGAILVITIRHVLCVCHSFVQLSLLGCVALHLCWAHVRAPASLPDLWLLLFAVYAAGHFIITAIALNVWVFYLPTSLSSRVSTASSKKQRWCASGCCLADSEVRKYGRTVVDIISNLHLNKTKKSRSKTKMKKKNM